MRKFTACVLSAGILMLTGVGDVEGLFGKKTANTDSVSFSIFGGDTTNLITAANNLKIGLTDGKKAINVAIIDMKKQTIDLKTFDKTATVMPIVFISERLANVGTFFETLASLLDKEITGLKSINSAKSLGNANEVSGRQAIRLSRKVMKILEADLASIRANIALIHKLLKGEKEKRVSNAGAIKNILAKLQTNFKNAKRNITALVATYVDESEKIASSAKDKEMQKLFRDSIIYITAARDAIDLSVTLVDRVITYAETGDCSDLEEFSRECEELLATGDATLRSQIDRYDEVDRLERTNRGNVNRRKEELESNSTFRSERGRRAYENSVEREDFESVAPASRQLKHSQSSGSISNYRSNNNRKYRDSRADDED